MIGSRGLDRLGEGEMIMATPRRRLAQGSSTGEQALQAAAVKAVDAHLKVQAAAGAVSAALDDSSLPPKGIEVSDDSIVLVIERAQRRLGLPS